MLHDQARRGAYGWMNKRIKNVLSTILSSVKNSKFDKTSEIGIWVRFYNSSLGKYSYISNSSNVFFADIGNFTSIGLRCNIGGGEHPIDWVSTSTAFQANRTVRHGLYDNAFLPYKKTIIGNDVWIGANVIIKSGVHIEDGAVIGAGAVVTHDVGAYEIWGGVPARLIKKRFDEETIIKLRRTQWWDWDDQKLVEVGNLIPNVNEFLSKCEEEL